MSRFNDYAKKLNEIANGTFEEYRKAEAALKSAESRSKEYPRRNGADPSYLAKSARAEADLAEANAQFEHCRRHLFEEQRRDIAVIRAELVEALNKEYAADPSKVDIYPTKEEIRSDLFVLWTLGMPGFDQTPIKKGAERIYKQS